MSCIKSARQSYDYFARDIAPRALVDPMHVRVKGEVRVMRMDFTDEGGVDFIVGSREHVEPEFKVLHEYSQAREISNYVDAEYNAYMQGLPPPLFPYVRPYEPIVESTKYETHTNRESYDDIVKDLNARVDPRTPDSILDVRKDEEPKESDVMFSGMLDTTDLIELEMDMQLPRSPVHYIDNEDVLMKSEKKKRRIALIFNPFSMAAVARLVEIKRKKVRDSIVFYGRYMVQGREYKFQYCNNSKQYRVPYEIWSRVMGIENYFLSCYDLVAYFDFWKYAYKDYVLKTWYPQLFKPVDRDKVKKSKNYDICNSLGRVVETSDHVMSCGAAGVSTALVRECIVCYEGDYCELQEDSRGMIVPVVDRLSGAVIYVGPLTDDEIEAEGLRRIRGIRRFKCVESFTGVVSVVPDLIRCTTMQSDLVVYYPRLMREGKISKVVRNRERDLLLDIDFKFKNRFVLLKAVMTFFPTASCYFNEEECYVIFDGDPFDMIGALMNMGKHSLFRMESRNLPDELAFKEIIYAADDGDNG